MSKYSRLQKLSVIFLRNRLAFQSTTSLFHLPTHSRIDYFEVGEHPHLPRRCEHFLRFSSKISGRSLADPYIRGVYKIAQQWLGDRVYF